MFHSWILIRLCINLYDLSQFRQINSQCNVHQICSRLLADFQVKMEWNYIIPSTCSIYILNGTFSHLFRHKKFSDGNYSLISQSVVRSHLASRWGLSCRWRFCVDGSQWLLWWYWASGWTGRFCPKHSKVPSSAVRSGVLCFSEQNEIHPPFTEIGGKYNSYINIYRFLKPFTNLSNPL